MTPSGRSAVAGVGIVPESVTSGSSTDPGGTGTAAPESSPPAADGTASASDAGLPGCAVAGFSAARGASAAVSVAASVLVSMTTDHTARH
ncbi:hypothetical protein ABK046_13780 [Streptomyces caeruleatus]